MRKADMIAIIADRTRCLWLELIDLERRRENGEGGLDNMITNDRARWHEMERLCTALEIDWHYV